MTELSFQERYRQAKAAAAALHKPAKAPKPKAEKKPKAERVVVVAEKPEKRVKAILTARKQQREATPSRGIFKTLPVNLAEKIKIVIDSKTTVYAKPGADIEAIKAKYTRKPTVRIEDEDCSGYQF